MVMHLAYCVVCFDLLVSFNILVYLGQDWQKPEYKGALHDICCMCMGGQQQMDNPCVCGCFLSLRMDVDASHCFIFIRT